MSVTVGFVLWYGEEPRNLAVVVTTVAPFQSVSEIYAEVTFAEDLDAGHDVLEIWGASQTSAVATVPRKLRVARHYYGQPGSKPRLEVKVTSGEMRYEVVVQSSTGPQGIQLEPFAATPSKARGMTGETIIIEQVEEQGT